MSIETNLASIAQSLATISLLMKQDNEAGDRPAPQAVPVPPPVPVPVPAVPAAPTVPAFAMPMPVPAPAPAVPVGPAAPFTDGKGLMEYVMGKYRALGPVKGGMIQNVLSEIGCKNINEVQPAQYGEFHARVEAIQ